jgi:hypothetical protein
MTADRFHRSLQQRVTSSMTVSIVDSLQADDIDIGNHERRHRSVRTIDLVMKILQARRTRTRPGQPSVLAIAS